MIIGHSVTNMDSGMDIITKRSFFQVKGLVRMATKSTKSLRF